MSAAVPEIDEFGLALPTPSLVLNGEVIALRADGRPLPFQETMRRFGRKLDVALLRHAILTPFFSTVSTSTARACWTPPHSSVVKRWRAASRKAPACRVCSPRIGST